MAVCRAAHQTHLLPGWQQGCSHKYRVFVCRPQEAQKALVWKQREQQHQVSDRQSNTISNTSTNFSSSKAAGDGRPESSNLAELIENDAVKPSLGPQLQQMTRSFKEHSTKPSRKGAQVCKAQHDQYTEYLGRLREQIYADPRSFDPMKVHLPPNIFDGKQEAKSKFVIRLSALADYEKGKLSEEAERNAHDSTASRSHAVNTPSSCQIDRSASSSQADTCVSRRRSASSDEALRAKRGQRNIVCL